jgi:hypothetical protein
MVIALLFLVVTIQCGFLKEISGQISTIFTALFGMLSIGSFIKPESIGQITAQYLSNLGRNVEDRSNNSRTGNNITNIQEITTIHGTVVTNIGSEDSKTIVKTTNKHKGRR